MIEPRDINIAGGEPTTVFDPPTIFLQTVL